MVSYLYIMTVFILFNSSMKCIFNSESAGAGASGGMRGYGGERDSAFLGYMKRLTSLKCLKRLEKVELRRIGRSCY
jgi:hypothetical protein